MGETFCVHVSARKFDAFASKWRRTRRKMKELYSKNVGKQKTNLYERIMKLERTYIYEERLNFKRRRKKKEKKICSTDLQTCVIKKYVMYLLHYSLYRFCNPTLY